MNYQHHFSLTRSPFGPVTTSDAFYSATPQRESLARIDYLVRSASRSAVLLSHRGCGASTLMRRIAATSGFSGIAVQPVLTSGGVNSRRAALARLAIAIGIDPFVDQLTQRIEESIRAFGRSQVKTLWLIDRCDAATAEAAATMASSSSSLVIVMGSTLQDAASLQDALDFCPLRIDLDAFHLDDTFGYVRFAIAAAGARSELFEDSAIVRLHELGEGRIAMIAAMAELSLLAAANHGRKIIHAELVETVQNELVRAA